MNPHVTTEDPRLSSRLIDRIAHTSNSVLLFLIIAEAVLMGTGRLLQIGPITVRMILFALGLLSTIIQLLYGRKIKDSSWLILLFFVSITIIGALHGMIVGYDGDEILNELKPVSNFFLLPFFELSIDSWQRIKIAENALLISVGILVFLYCIYFTLLTAGIISPFELRFVLIGLYSSDANDFWFAPESGWFFYQGFVYLVLGALLSFSRPSIWMKFGGVLAVATLLFSGNRGVLATSVVACVVYVFLFARKISTKIGALSVAAIMVVFLAYIQSTSNALQTTKSENDQIRQDTASEVWERVTPTSFFGGHGLGRGVPTRPTNMENTYLNVLHTQGMIGLTFWGAFLGLFFIRFLKVRNSLMRPQARAFFIASLAIFGESVADPYINSPIGMNIVLLALAFFCFAERQETQQVLTT
jgi:hypothetical protein